MTLQSPSQTHAKHLIRLLSRQSGIALTEEQRESGANLIHLLLEKESLGESFYNLADSDPGPEVKQLLSRIPFRIETDAQGNELLYTARTHAAFTGVREWFEAQCKKAQQQEAPNGFSLELLKEENCGPNLTLGADDQIPAVSKAADNDFTIITGGPGTGKTTIIAACIAELFLRNREIMPEQFILTAPTGKAAHRLTQGLRDFIAAQNENLKPALLQRMQSVPDAVTLHRLLGASKTRTLPLKGDIPTLAQKVVVIDECSMVSSELMCALMKSLSSDAKLILVGDADQLPSVEGGSMFHTLVKDLENSGSTLVQRLVHSRRSVIEIITEAKKALADGAEAAFDWSPLGRDEQLSPQPVRFINGIEGMKSDLSYSDWLQEILVKIFRQFAATSDWAHQEGGFTRFKIITQMRKGVGGVIDLNARMAELARKNWNVRSSGYIAGEPIMVTENIHALGLSNGDVGIVEHHDSDSADRPSGTSTGMYARFHRGNDHVRIPLSYLSGRIERAWASTCHKAQGSEYDNVFILLPRSEDSKGLTPQWLYTAMTRARTRLTLISNKNEYKKEK